MPQVVAGLYFRHGLLTRAYEAATRAGQSQLAQRIEFMLGVLESPPERSKDGYGPSRVPYSGQVLQVFHSCITFDPNGYAARSEQLLDSLARVGVGLRVVTRLGYPWDLNAHSGVDGALRTSDSTRATYWHKPSVPRKSQLTGRESEYLASYSDWIVDQACEHGATIIHAHSNFLNGLAAGQAALRMGLKSVYEMRGLWHVTRATREPRYAETEHYRYCERREVEAAALVDAVVAITQELAQWLIERGIDADKITVIPNACAVVQPVCVRSAAFAIDKPTIGFVGSFVHYEGLDLLVLAAAKLIKSKPGLKIVLVGDGPDANRIKKLITQYGLTDVFELPGRVRAEEVRKYYQRFDVGVVPRRCTPITQLVASLKPMEMMAYGVPCVASDLKPLASLVRDREHLLLTAADDSHSLYRGLKELLDDPKLAKDLREGGLAWAASNSWSANARTYCELYGERHAALDETHGDSIHRD